MPRTRKVVIADYRIQMLWICNECEENIEEWFGPEWYQENGTPSCQCGRDMQYVQTEVDLSELYA